ncbi:CD226 antigen-like isoform X2 [Scomber scombrus]|uniref:CD226 antigen-like isoform X2 n=1 Tax=Scomber scombrus TaxID=13677 RepID=UPI002DDA489A|nr:CD226 antigen-like isoform X2 [Scomber scombrus]
MAASVITVLFLFSCLLQSASADLQKQNVTVQPGDDVTLSCKAPNNVNMSAVEWSRSDFEKHVYMKTDGRLNTADQDPSYVNRTQLKDDEMKNGELSLILKNVKSNDGGTYECRYVGEGEGRRNRSLNDGKLISIVQLNVEDLQLQPIKEITVRPGDNVTLPCEAPNNVNISAVEWIRSNLKKHVYLKSDGHLNTADQDPSYVNRVQLKDDEMKNGELSLILKNVSSNDNGTYECYYLEERGSWKRALIDGEPISTVILNVKDGDAESGKLSESGKDSEGGHLGVILTFTLIIGFVVVVGVIVLVIYKKPERMTRIQIFLSSFERM